MSHAKDENGVADAYSVSIAKSRLVGDGVSVDLGPVERFHVSDIPIVASAENFGVRAHKPERRVHQGIGKSRPTSTICASPSSCREVARAASGEYPHASLAGAIMCVSLTQALLGVSFCTIRHR